MKEREEYDPVVIANLTSQIQEMARTQERHHVENKEVQGKILDQVERTNGRVSALEKWKYLITGGLAVIVFVICRYVEWHK